MVARSFPLLAACLVSAASAGCKEQSPPPPQSMQASPNASILPAPLASAGDLVRKKPDTAKSGTPVGIPADSAGRLIAVAPEAPPPQPISVNEALPRDYVTSKDGVGITLKARWIWADLPPRPPIPELSIEGIKSATEKTALNVTADLAYVGRMRFRLDSIAFPLPARTEIKARADYFGHALVWADGARYRPLAPGTLRAVFAERRADVTPVMRAKVKRLGGGNQLGFKTEQVQLATNVGTVTLEQAHLAGSGRSGTLLCRLLIDLVAVDPQSEACVPERVPVVAHYEWVDGGSLSFRVETMENRLDLPVTDVMVPPPAAEFMPGELPPQATGVFLTREELAHFRTRAALGKDPPTPGAPGEGITAVNHTDTLRYLLIDGVPAAWIRPGEERYLIGPRPGRYSVAWRDFFGTSIQAPALVELPARVEIGVPASDAGSEPR